MGKTYRYTLDETFGRKKNKNVKSQRKTSRQLRKMKHLKDGVYNDVKGNDDDKKDSMGTTERY